MMRLRHARVVILVGLALLWLPGCEPKVTVEPRLDLGTQDAAADATRDLHVRVETLAREAQDQAARADALETELARLREENVVLATDTGFTFRINTQAAWVLIVAILGLTTFFVARMRYAAAGPSAQDGHTPA